MSVSDWDVHFGGKPEGRTNFNFLNEKFRTKNNASANSVKGEDEK